MTDYAYVRVSTDQQDNETQITLIKNRAPDALVFQDVISGASEKPALASLRDVLCSGDTLYLYSFDRLSRSLLESLELISEFMEGGVKVISLTQGIDVSTVTGKAMFSMLQTFAEMERNLISQRTKAKLAVLKAQGVPLGGARKGAGRKGHGPLSDAEKLFLKEALSGSKDWESQAVLFKEKFGKDYRPNTLRRKAYKV